MFTDMADYNNNGVSPYEVLPEAIGFNAPQQGRSTQIGYGRQDVANAMKADYDAYNQIRNNWQNPNYSSYNDPNSRLNANSRLDMQMRNAWNEFTRNYGMTPNEYEQMIGSMQNRSNPTIPRSYGTGSSDVVRAIQNTLHDYVPGVADKYGSNFIDGKFGNNTATAMLDTINMFDGTGISTDGNLSDKVRRIQKYLRDSGYKGVDGKDITVDGKFGKNTAQAFSDYYYNFRANQIKQKEEQESQRVLEEQMAQQQAQEAAEREAAEREAYANSSAVRAEQPRRDMFSGVGLGIPPQFVNNYNDVAESDGTRYVGTDVLGRPIYK